MYLIQYVIRVLCVLCFTFATLGCYKYVDVPVWVCPYPDIPIKETLKTDTVSGLDDKETLKAFAWDLVYLKGRSSALEILLNGYKQPPEDLKKLLPNPKKD